MTEQIRAITGDTQLSCDLVQLEPAKSGGPVVELIAFRPNPAGSAFRPGQGAGGAHLAYCVDALEPAVADAVAFGATLIGAVTDFSDCQAVYLAAPGGLLIELEQPREQAVGTKA